MNLKPLNDILVIKRIMDEQPRTSSGILLPPTEEAADTPYTGVVLAAGPGKPCTIQPAANVVDGALRAVVRIPMQVKVGDKVIYSRHGHQTFRVDGDDLVTFGQDSVIGVLEEERATSQPMNLYP